MVSEDEDAREALIGFFMDECYMEREEVETEKTLFSKRRLDSLDFMDLTAFLDEKFGIEVDTSEMELKEFDSLDSITLFVITKTS